jgi:predicted TIM-barrel fold metal-dependent hydrolase
MCQLTREAGRSRTAARRRTQTGDTEDGVEYRIIDCDQHVIEPPDLWEKWLPARFHDRAPRLVRDDDGGDAWELGGHVESLGLVAAKEMSPRDLKWTGVRYADMHPGITDPKARLELMDEDGVDAAVFFPPQRTMIYFMSVDDAAFHLAGMRAYNEFISDWVSHCPERLGAIWQMPGTNVADAVAELRAAAAAGAVGVGLATWPSGGALLSREDDAFWCVAEELGMPVHVHIGLVPAGHKTQRVAARKGGAPQLVMLASTMSRMPVLFAELIFNEVFERFPGLTIVGGEVGAGWVPYLLQEMDDRYRRNRYWCEVDLSMLPSEYYRRNCKVGFIRDTYGVQNCDAVGVETMMWASDFPHHINDWPNSRYLIDEMAHGLDAAKKRRIFCENAGRLYGFVR